MTEESNSPFIFLKSLHRYGPTDEINSSKFPQSNGEAEAEKAVVVCNNILSACEDPNLGLLAYKSTPLESGHSPAELLFERKIRTSMPMINENLKPKAVDLLEFKANDSKL